MRGGDTYIMDIVTKQTVDSELYLTVLSGNRENHLWKWALIDQIIQKFKFIFQ